MGRQPSVTIENVQAAIAALRSEGRNVSSRSVREQLGNVGSMGTINKLLQQCLNAKVVEPDSLRQLPSELQHAVLTYADQHAQEARTQIADELLQCRRDMSDLADDNERLTETVEDLRQQVTTLVADAAVLQGRNAQLESGLENARREVAMERHAAETVRIELMKLQTRSEQIEPLAGELRTIRERLETERVNRMQVQQSVAVLEVQKGALEQANKNLHDELAAERLVNGTSNSKIEQLTALLDQERAARVLAERELAVKDAMHAGRQASNGNRKKRLSQTPAEQT